MVHFPMFDFREVYKTNQTLCKCDRHGVWNLKIHIFMIWNSISDALKWLSDIKWFSTKEPKNHVYFVLMKDMDVEQRLEIIKMLSTRFWKAESPYFYLSELLKWSLKYLSDFHTILEMNIFHKNDKKCDFPKRVLKSLKYLSHHLSD